MNIGFARLLASLVVVGLTSLTVGTTYAAWSDGYRAGYRKGCIESCEERAGSGAPECARHCNCVVERLEARFPDDLRYSRARKERDPGTLAATENITQACRKSPQPPSASPPPPSQPPPKGSSCERFPNLC